MILPESMQLIVGLGNPGEEYAHSRHNVGFMIIDSLISRYGIQDHDKDWETAISKGLIENRKVLLAKPMGYMNRSGLPVEKLLSIYGFKSEECIVIHDDLDLALGRIKIKEKGGHGGHRGIQSLIDAIGDRFVRLRIGIGRPAEGMDVIDHVLGNFKPEELETLEQVIVTSQKAVSTILCYDAKEGMNRFNSNNNQIIR